jgi:hypothetical protein
VSPPGVAVILPSIWGWRIEIKRTVPDFGRNNLLIRGDITVLMDSNWSWGLVLHVPAKKRNLKGSICFNITNECWKTILENYGKS